MSITFQDLPEEIVEKIFLYLSPYQEYDIVALVCKQWSRIISGVAIQRQKCFEAAFSNKNLIWTEATLQSNKNGTNANASFMSPRLLHSMCYNDASRSVYVFGGRSVGSQLTGFNDLWRLDMHTKKWERPLISGGFPPPKFGCSLESYKSNLVLYGGQSMPRSNSLGLYRPGYYNELHIFDTTCNKWKLKPSLQAESPPGLCMHGTCIVTNQSGDEDTCMIIFGGVREPGGINSNEIWCLDLFTFSWWKPTIIGSLPGARHMHTQTSFKNSQTFSSAVLILGGCTTENQVLSDAWILIRSGYTEWTSTSLNIMPGPSGFLPPLSVFKRSAVKVGQTLVFFGSCPAGKVPSTRKAIRRVYPYSMNDTDRPPPVNSHSDNSIGWNHLKVHLNPICTYMMDLSQAVSQGVVTWQSSTSEDDECVNPSFLGPNKPNFHVAAVARGEIVVHGDFPLTAPQAVERTIRQSRDFIRSTGFSTWTPLYFLSEDIS